RFERRRMTLSDGRGTAVHIATYELRAFTPRVVALEQPTPLARWCKQQGVRHALVGGFFVRPQYAPLGRLWIDGEPRSSVPFDKPWDSVRSCMHVSRGTVRIATADKLEAHPTGDLLQAG